MNTESDRESQRQFDAFAQAEGGFEAVFNRYYDRAYEDLVKAQKLDDAIPNIRTYIGMVKKKRR